jgi:hypothetical protein
MYFFPKGSFFYLVFYRLINLFIVWPGLCKPCFLTALIMIFQIVPLSFPTKSPNYFMKLGIKINLTKCLCISIPGLNH